MKQLFVVDQNKVRLDRYLADQDLGISRSTIQRDIEEGLVLVNGEKVLEGKHVVRLEDKVEYDLEKKEKAVQEHVEINTVFENEDLLIINKPPGLVVHPAPGYKGPTLAGGLLEKYKDIEFIGEDVIRPGIVHRLDKDTSGVMLVAKTQPMFDHLKDTFASRENIKKEYITLVCGKVNPKHGIINTPIGKHPSDFRKMTTHLPKDAKESLTEYSVIKYLKGPGVDEYTLVRVKLHTGRTHQIRVHFSSLGHPIAGDTLYGKCKAPDLNRQFLHAAKIEVKLFDGTWIEADAPLPEDLEKALSNLTELQ